MFTQYNLDIFSSLELCFIWRVLTLIDMVAEQNSFMVSEKPVNVMGSKPIKYMAHQIAGLFNEILRGTNCLNYGLYLESIVKTDMFQTVKNPKPA